MTDTNQVKGDRLDQWLDSYAARAHGLRASETRSLFAVAARPEVVSLAGGMPNLKDLPLDQLADATARMIREDGGRALQYGNGQGLPRLREQIPEVMALEGIDADPEDIIVTPAPSRQLTLSPSSSSTRETSSSQKRRPMSVPCRSSPPTRAMSNRWRSMQTVLFPKHWRQR